MLQDILYGRISSRHRVWHLVDIQEGKKGYARCGVVIDEDDEGEIQLRLHPARAICRSCRTYLELDVRRAEQDARIAERA